MTEKEKKVVDALKKSFADTIGGLGGKVGSDPKTMVTMPVDEIWLGYAKAAISALEGGAA